MLALGEGNDHHTFACHSFIILATSSCNYNYTLACDSCIFLVTNTSNYNCCLLLRCLAILLSSRNPKKSFIRHSRLIVKNPTVLLPRLRFLLGGQLGDVQNDSNFFGALAHELTGNLKTGQVEQRFLKARIKRNESELKDKEGGAGERAIDTRFKKQDSVALTNGHEIGSRDQIKQHWLVDALDELLIPAKRIHTRSVRGAMFVKRAQQRQRQTRPRRQAQPQPRQGVHPRPEYVQGLSTATGRIHVRNARRSLTTSASRRRRRCSPRGGS